MNNRETWLLPLLLLSPLLGAGCGGGPATVSPTEELLLAARKAHGGVDRWRQYSGVRFVYEVRFSEEAPGMVFPEVAFRLDDYRHLWVTPPGSEESIRLRLDSEWGSVVRALRGAGLNVEGQGVEREWTLSLLEFSLRSIRYLFQLPLATSTGRWRFHSLVAPSNIDVDLGPVLEVVPAEPGAPVGPCLLVLDPVTYRMSKVVYVPTQSPPGPRGIEVAFEGYEAVEGVLVAGGRNHTEIQEEKTGFDRSDPFGLELPPEKPEARVLIQEQVTRVAFLGAETMLREYARPEDVDPEGVTPDATYRPR